MMLAAAAVAAGKFIGSVVLPCALQWLLPAVGNQPAVDRTDPRRSLGRQACIGLWRGIPLTSDFWKEFAEVCWVDDGSDSSCDCRCEFAWSEEFR